MNTGPCPSTGEFQKPGNSRAPLKQPASEITEQRLAVSMKTEARDQCDRDRHNTRDTRLETDPRAVTGSRVSLPR